MKLSEMIENLAKWLSEQGYAEATMNVYEKAITYVKSEFLRYEENYDPQIANDFVLLLHQKYERNECDYNTFRNVRKVISLLNEYFETDKFVWKTLPNWRISALNDYFVAELRRFSSYWESCEAWSHNELRKQTRLAEDFYEFLQTHQYNSLNEITVKTFVDYVSAAKESHNKGIKNIVNSIRCICKYLKENDICEIDPQDLTAFSTPNRRTLMPVFTANDVSKILGESRGSYPQEKRDYAIFAIAASTGLRVSDIVKLKRTDIDWRKHEIRIVQQKTGMPNTLPLEIYVGNAIADYINNVRPKSDDESIFLTLKPPCRALRRNAVGRNLRKVMGAIGIEEGKGLGMHSFRRFVATSLLENGVLYERIADILGHKDTKSLKSYLRTTVNQLRKCALTLDGIEISQEALL